MTEARVENVITSLIVNDQLPLSPEHPCPYLADREAQENGFIVESLDPDYYHRLMDLGFRRSGKVFYRPNCPAGCVRCVQLRIPVASFAASRSQRRAYRRNRDLTLEINAPQLTGEKEQLYRRYIEDQHPKEQHNPATDLTSLRDFLYASPVDTIELEYRFEGRLVAVSIIDRSRESLSSVYHFFDPAEGRRSLGVFSVLREIELAKRWGIPFYYLGFWIRGAKTMAYKANYYPHELLLGGRWVRRNKIAKEKP